MLTIHLHKLLFHAYHGFYVEEQILGNEFEINADIVVAVNEHITNIQHTVDYTSIYNVIKQRMQLPTALLETVAQELTEAIGKLDERIKSVCITINKLTPPLENFQGSIGVSYKNVF